MAKILIPTPLRPYTDKQDAVDATGATGEAAQVEGIKESHGDANEVFVEVVEYADGVTICAVYEKDAQPGRCHRGGADSDHHGWSWHNNNHTKLNFNVKVPRGVVLKAMTTNGGIRGRDLNSVVDAATTNGNVDVGDSLFSTVPGVLSFIQTPIVPQTGFFPGGDTTLLSLAVKAYNVNMTLFGFSVYVDGSGGCMQRLHRRLPVRPRSRASPRTPSICFSRSVRRFDRSRCP